MIAKEFCDYEAAFICFGACGTHEKDEKCIQRLVGKSGGKRPFGRPRHRWENDIKMGIRERKREVVYWIHLVQGRDQ
jgi:hypothetical protein